MCKPITSKRQTLVSLRLGHGEDTLVFPLELALRLPSSCAYLPAYLPGWLGAPACVAFARARARAWVLGCLREWVGACVSSFRTFQRGINTGRQYDSGLALLFKRSNPFQTTVFTILVGQKFAARLPHGERAEGRPCKAKS